MKETGKQCSVLSLGNCVLAEVQHYFGCPKRIFYVVVTPKVNIRCLTRGKKYEFTNSSSVH